RPRTRPRVRTRGRGPGRGAAGQKDWARRTRPGAQCSVRSRTTAGCYRCSRHHRRTGPSRRTVTSRTPTAPRRPCRRRAPGWHNPGMRVRLTGAAAPPPPDGAWPQGGTTPAAGQGVPTLADVASWWAPHADLDVVALAAEGSGFLDALAPVAPEVLAGVVPGPAGSEVPVALRRRTADAGGAPTRPTVYVDASQVPAAGDAGTLGPGSPDPTVPARS